MARSHHNLEHPKACWCKPKKNDRGTWIHKTAAGIVAAGEPAPPPITWKQAQRHLGIILRSKREELGIRQTRMARDLSYSEMTISRIENGDTTSLQTLLRCAQYLGVPFAILFDGLDGRISLD